MQYKLPLAVSIAAFAVATVPSSFAQVPRIYYDFNTDPALANGSVIDNKTAGQPDGIVSLGSGTASFGTSGAPGPSGRALTLSPLNDTDQTFGAPYIDTGLTAFDLNITPSTPYTVMAWANFANAIGDNMIFGGGGQPVLHNGSRNGNLHSGHWGDDIGPDQGINISSQPGTWHHVAYTNDGAAGAQSIYFDGTLVAGPGAFGTGGTMQTGINLFIGTSDNGGSFRGQLDEVKVFDTELTQAQIQAASVVVPEPTSLAVMMLSGLGVFALRRRR